MLLEISCPTVRTNYSVTKHGGPNLRYSVHLGISLHGVQSTGGMAERLTTYFVLHDVTQGCLTKNGVTDIILRYRLHP